MIKKKENYYSKLFNHLQILQFLIEGFKREVISNTIYILQILKNIKYNTKLTSNINLSFYLYYFPKANIKNFLPLR